MTKLFARFMLLIAALGIATPTWGAPQQATPASSFHDSICVVIQPAFVAEAEWNNNLWPGFLADLGVKNVRGKLSTNLTAVSRLKPYFASGGKMIVTVVAQSGSVDKVKTKKNLLFLAANVPSANLVGLESANELNHNYSATDTARILRDLQPFLRSTVSAIPQLAKVPLVAPSIYIRDPAVYKAVGNLEPNVDRWNLHYYNEGRRPPITGGLTKPGTLAQAILDARILAPTKPGYITEMGYKQATPDASPAAGVLSERAAAIYSLRAYLDYYAAGVEKSCIYSLIDDAARGKINHGLRMTAAQGFKPRANFHAIKNLTALFADPGVGSGSLDYSLAGAPASLRKQLFVKSDGTFLLTMYQDVDSWNRSTKRDTVVAPANVTITLPASASFQVYRPTFGAAAVQTANGNRIVVPVADDAVVLAVRP